MRNYDIFLVVVLLFLCLLNTYAAYFRFTQNQLQQNAEYDEHTDIKGPILCKIIINTMCLCV